MMLLIGRFHVHVPFPFQWMSIHVSVISNFTWKKSLRDLILFFNEKLYESISRIKMLKCFWF